MKNKTIDCSLKSVLSVTLPMILSAMSSNLMYMIDRFMLAGYSIDSMNAATMSGNFVSIFSFLLCGSANSAEIFAGQYNGSKQYERLAAPTWQMFYMSLFAYIPCFLIAYFSVYINNYPPYYLKEGVEYQKVLMYFIMFPPIRAALAAFFIGQGKTKVITFSVTTGALLNIVLDYLLIYGLAGFVPSLGCKGAAIATVISEFVQISILASIFFGKTNRKAYNTFGNRKLESKLFFECWQVGFPIALGNCVALLAWYIIQVLFSHVSKDVATVYNITTNLYVFFIFVGEGVNKGIAAISANMIGRNDLKSIEKTRKIFVIISILFGGIVAVPMVIYPEGFFYLLSMLPDDISRLYSEIKIACYLVSLDVALETLTLAHWGILMAGGDTKYANIVYQICLWGITILPMTVLCYTNTLTSAMQAYFLITLTLGATLFFIYRRYKSGKWYKKLV
ncbi:MAG: MATE family efflux transporter [Holosporaceae bacterium]|jgi:MATE family multidrug resistance protein|nr:MATE family efflux transporter [Holosporaceae bacterium]